MSKEIIQKENNLSKGGARTPEGKAISKYNAQKHAILRETITEYEKADAEQIYNELTDDLKPNGRLQELIVENIASNVIRLMRISKAEAEHIMATLYPSIKELDLGGYIAQVKHDSVEKLGLYSRYQTATENRIHRSIMLLKALQKYENS